MGIRFSCPNGHSLHVKEHLAGKRGICPNCGAKFLIPTATNSPAPAPMPAGATAPSIAGNVSQAANPSVIIPLAADTAAAPVASSAAPPIDVFPPPAGNSIPTVDSELSAGPGLVAVTQPDQTASPAINYVAHRERVRRNRTRIAILLLLAVIVLAGVLVWMLVAGPAAVGGSQGSLDVRPATHLAWSAQTIRIGSPIGGSNDEL